MQITGGFLNSRKVKTEKFQNIKPTLSKTRQGIFNSLSSIMDFEDKSFLDMFSGSAIMSFEAVSRGFNPVYTFEKDIKTAQAIKENFNSFGIDHNLYVGDALKLIKKINQQFNVIFIDPPYGSDLYNKSLAVIRENNILNDSGIIILEHQGSNNIDFTGFSILKEKKYGTVLITFLKKAVKQN